MTAAVAEPALLPWLNVAEAARLSRRHPETVRYALNAGELHGHQKHPRGRWIVHVDSVTAWIEADDPAVAAIASARVCTCGKVRILRPA
jgi:Helix-turn-helix domain